MHARHTNLANCTPRQTWPAFFRTFADTNYLAASNNNCVYVNKTVGKPYM